MVSINLWWHWIKDCLGCFFCCENEAWGRRLWSSCGLQPQLCLGHWLDEGVTNATQSALCTCRTQTGGPGGVQGWFPPGTAACLVHLKEVWDHRQPCDRPPSPPEKCWLSPRTVKTIFPIAYWETCHGLCGAMSVRARVAHGCPPGTGGGSPLPSGLLLLQQGQAQGLGFTGRARCMEYFCWL